MTLSTALRHARDNDYVSKFKMAAVLTINKKEYIGQNQYKTHPIAARFSPNGSPKGVRDCVAKRIHIHCELAAILQALRAGHRPPFGGALYIARVLKNGLPGLAKPCTGCSRAIAAFGIDEVYYTTDEDKDV